VDTSGNVGIGTSSPDAKLDVTGPASVTSFTGSTRLGLTVQGSAAATDYSGIDFSGNNQLVPTARIAVLSESGGSILSFGTSNNYATGITNQALSLDYLGNVLVGTTNTNFQNADGIRFFPTGSAGASFVSFTNGGNGGTNLTLVNSNGSTTSWNAITFQFNTTAVGSISCTPTTTAYNQSSDRRLKTAVAPAADAGALLDAVQVVEFDWKVGGHVRYGVIAQDLHLIAPEAVTPGDSNEEVERPWGVDYSKLVPMLIKEVQSLRARVAALEAK
jgi:hypothetical protein